MDQKLTVGDVFVRHPADNPIRNDGVADLDQDATLRWELQNFVCEGQYAAGLERILQSYLSNQDGAQQPGVWVSGFYGSGKSHLIKVLWHLWTDTPFADGATPRGLAKLPANILDQLAELSTIGKRGNGLIAAAGELQHALPIRRGLLAVLFRSFGLPEAYPAASLVTWLRKEGVLETFQSSIEAAGKAFNDELRHMWVSPVIAQALLEATPHLADDNAGALAQIRTQFPQLDGDQDITEQEMLDAMADLLGAADRMPCSLVVLDEVQQYIGDETDRAGNVQQVTQACTKHFGDRLLFVATGQAALSGTQLLQKLQDRFTVRVELSDTDVEKVTRNIVLAKTPDKMKAVQAVVDGCSGEIDRQLQGTRIGPRTEDKANLVADYPILPVRRRFWERVLREVDRAGTAAQLRTQLRIVHDAALAIADGPLGAVVPADFIYRQQSVALLESGVLLRDIYETILRQQADANEGELKYSLCALSWLIGEITRTEGADVGVRATPETMADLLVADLREGSAGLRERIPAVLDDLEGQGVLMKVGDEYLIQTQEGQVWQGDFNTQFAAISNDAGRIADERSQLLRTGCGDELQAIKLIHGASKVSRQLGMHFSQDAPDPSDGDVPVWIRDEWSDSEKNVLHDARDAGPDSPIVFVFLPRHDSDRLREAIAEWKAAETTLGLRGVPSTPEGLVARQAMETREQQAKVKVDGLVAEILGLARVFQAGGNEVTGVGLQGAVQQAADRALTRLYPDFNMADSPKWPRVVQQAKGGDGNCLAALGYEGEVADHPVCKEIIADLGPGKKGREVRQHFRSSPYGWSQDAIDGALLALTVGGLATATEHGKPIELKVLDQTKIGVADFRPVTVQFTTQQRIAVRKLLQDANVNCKTNEEIAAIPELITWMVELADSASGDPPAPKKPTVTHIEDLRSSVGNELGVALYEMQDRVTEELTEWGSRAEAITKRLPEWEALLALLGHASGLPIAAEVAPQVEAIRQNRSLLDEPDPVAPLSDRLADALRQAVNEASATYEKVHTAGMKTLTEAADWQQLDDSQRTQISAQCALDTPDQPKTATEAELLDSLNGVSLADWRNRADALPQRFGNATLAAAQLLAPEAIGVELPARTLASAEDVETYLEEVKTLLMGHINNGQPVVLK